jgi:molybdopterin-containing oxidoreductase family molybdopterin binding subunit
MDSKGDVVSDIVEKEREQYRKIFGERDKRKDYWSHTMCSICYEQCAIKVRVVEGKPIAIEGVPESDAGSRGGVCAKGVASIMDWHDPNRILFPVKRTNPKKGLHEDPKWQRISWEEALDTTAKNLVEARKKDPRSVVWTHTPGPTGGMKSMITVAGYFVAYGTNSYCTGGPGPHCGAATHHIDAQTAAAWDVFPDYRYCNYVLRCGGNEGVGGGRHSAESIYMMAAARERGMKMKVLDPVGYRSAAKADEWIPILPGTDIAVLLSIANLIVNEIGIYDKEFLRHKTNGSYLITQKGRYTREEETKKPLLFDEADGKIKAYDDPTLSNPAIEGEYTVQGEKCQPAFSLIKEHLKQYKPDWASEISNVPEGTICQLADELVAEAKIGSTIEIEGVKVPYRPACVVGYRGLETHQNGFHTYASMQQINMLLGSQDVCGGLLGSGAVRSLGYPETGRFKFAPYAGFEGMLTPGFWHSRTPWPPLKPGGPGGSINFSDIFSHGSATRGHVYTDEWEELWTRAGRPFEPEVFFTYGGNVVMNMANPEPVERFLQKVPFAFAIQPFHNETTEGFCDIVLPEVQYLESLDVASAFGIHYCYPAGLDNWCFHMRMPVTEPKGETRNVQDILFDLAERTGIRPAYHRFLENYYALKTTTWEQVEIKDDAEHSIIGPEDNISNIELADRTLKYNFGNMRGLEWLRDNGFITWDKKPEEAYWRWFIEARIPIYYEGLAEDRKEIAMRAEKVGFHMDWRHYTGLITYFPSIIHSKPDPEYDLFVVSPRDPISSYRFSMQNPYLSEMALRDPFSLNITMNVETAKKKRIRDGDTVFLENRWGDKVSGNVKLTNLIHPQVIAMTGLGSWARGRPLARSKGVNPNKLLRLDQDYVCPITGTLEITAKAKVSNVGRP